MYKILTINLGATSTKVGVYLDEALQEEITIRHTDEDIASHPLQGQQLSMRHEMIVRSLAEKNIAMDEVSAVVIRASFGPTGAIMVKGGTYRLSGELHDYLVKTYTEDQLCGHPAVLTLPLADKLVADREIPIFLVDPTTVDEFEEVARITGSPLLNRSPSFHALNQKATARKAARELGKNYQDVKLVVAHMGGGVSIGAHAFGRVIDTSNGGAGQDGPFTPNRSGRLPIIPLVKLCFSGKYSETDIHKMIMVKGGFAAHTGYTDIRIVEKNAEEGDGKSRLILDAFVYQVCKEIAEQYSVLGFEADGFVLTGGLAYSKWIVRGIREKIDKLGPVFVYPGEEEGSAMAAGALRVLRGEEKAITMADLR